MYYMLFCCGLIFLLAVIIGFRRGVLGSLLRVVSFIIAVVATMVAAPIVVDLLYEKTDLDERIEKKIYT
ncbi:MAG: CvpA family protein [Eubacterium sp.]|nr:CvpA family protein [Eubacterium sp.]